HKPPTSTFVDPPNLLGRWMFDDGSGTSAVDASGYGNTATLTNGPVWVSGRAGQAVCFDGVNDYVDLGTRTGLNGQRVDPESGLLYFKNRHYSPDTGRFMSRDPLGHLAGASSLYEAEGSEPTRMVDPLGLIKYAFNENNCTAS